MIQFHLYKIQKREKLFCAGYYGSGRIGRKRDEGASGVIALFCSSCLFKGVFSLSKFIKQYPYNMCAFLYV